MDTATPQPEGSNFDAIRQPNVAYCSGEIASVNWAYGMPLSYVLEMANHWLGFHDQTARLADAGGSTTGRYDTPDGDKTRPSPIRAL